MRGRALIVAGSALIAVGLFVLSPAVWLIVDQLFEQILGAPLIGIVIGGGGIIVPMVLTAFGTAGIIGGAWMVANGNRRLREPAKPRVSVKPADNTPRPEQKTTIGE
jgi:hypothetical protein